MSEERADRPTAAATRPDQVIDLAIVNYNTASYLLDLLGSIEAVLPIDLGSAATSPRPTSSTAPRSTR